jgi:hypothetical protein
VTILLVGILIVNIFGFSIYFYFAEKQTNIAMENKIENELYSDQETIVYKVSARNLPYYTNSKQYELTTGEIEVDGQIKNYIKKRIYQDSIEYVLLNNIPKTKIRNARDEFFKLVYDFEKTSKHAPKKNTTAQKPFSFEAIENNNKIYCSLNRDFNKKNQRATNQSLLPAVHLETVCPPPNRETSFCFIIS